MSLETLNPRLHKISEILEPISERFNLGQTLAPRGKRPISILAYVKLAIFRAIMGLTYRDLAQATKENLSLRMFADILSVFMISKSTLQENISSLSEDLVKTINEALALAHGDFSRIRLDSTSVAANIAPPENSSLLLATVQRIRKIQDEISKIFEAGVFSFFAPGDHAKRLAYDIKFEKPDTEKRLNLYTDLLLMNANVMDKIDTMMVEAQMRTSELKTNARVNRLNKLVHEMAFIKEKISCVIAQTIAFLEHDKTIEAKEKLFTVANNMEHVDIIIKSKRGIVYGHKIDLIEAKNGVIIGLTIYEGNPADSSNLQQVVSSLISVYGDRINDIVADGGYNSIENLAEVKKLGVKKMVFSRKRSLSEEDMGTTKEKYQSDKNFRAGIERAIGRLKQRFGFRKVICTTFERFRLYLNFAVLAANVCRIALF